MKDLWKGLNNSDAEKACKQGIDYMLEKIGSRGGAIALSKTGFGYNFNTKRMPWCQKSDQGGFYGINPGEHKTCQ